MNIAIAYAYNNNGMASWCIEAAYACLAQGHNVMLVASCEVSLPSDIPVIRLAEEYKQSRTLLEKIKGKLFRYRDVIPFLYSESKLLHKIHDSLISQDFLPEVYLLNQSNLYNKELSVKQLVVAWANKPFLFDYISRAFVLSKGVKSFFNQLYNAMYWYNSDWFAYNNAYAVLAVTKTLQLNIAKYVKHAYVLYPPLMAKTPPLLKRESDKKKVSIGFFALNIDAPRKGYNRLLDHIASWNGKDKIILELIGQVSQIFIDKLEQGSIEYVLHGRLPRGQAIKVVGELDILIFGSTIDDWGFVQVEAMSCGVVVLAPNKYPSDEIIGDSTHLYNHNSSKDFLEKLDYAITKIRETEGIRIKQFERYQAHFSPEEFANKIEKIIRG